MGLESGTYIEDLVTSNPDGAVDTKAQGDNHLRLIKTVLKNTFPGLAGRSWRAQSKNSNYTVLATDNMSVINCTAAITLALTAAATLGNGHMFLVRANGFDVIIDPNGAELVNGAATLTVPNGDYAIVFCDGAAFFVVVLIPSAVKQTMIDAKGDLFVGTAADTVARKAVGSDGKLLQPSSGHTDGLAWTATPPQWVQNIKLVDSTAAGALTMALKTQDGGDATDDDPIFVNFRDPTLANSGYTPRKIVAALSMSLSVGSTLAHADGIASPLYRYLIDATALGGGVELAVSNKFHGYHGKVTTVAEGGAGAADSATAMYSTTARADVAFVCIGRSKSTQASAGTWATAMEEYQYAPFAPKVGSKQFFDTTGGGITYTKPWDLLWAKVTVQGGGGGGGGGDCNASSGNAGAAGGGGAGGGAIKVLDATTILPSETVTVGAGGNAGSGTNGTNGTAGGTSSFGAHASASGGGAGTGSGASAVIADATAGAAGGAGTVGDVLIAGGDGGCGIGVAADAFTSGSGVAIGGNGGTCALGSGGRGGASVGSASAGAGGNTYGGGGGGGVAVDTATGANGGAGAKGCVIVEEHYS